MSNRRVHWSLGPYEGKRKKGKGKDGRRHKQREAKHRGKKKGETGAAAGL